MQILGAPTTLELPLTEPLHLGLLVHNESDEDTVCFATLHGLDGLVDVEFEPQLGFIEARSTARFDVRLRNRDLYEQRSSGVELAWQLYAEGTLQDSHPCLLTLEPSREVNAEFVGTRAVRLENLGMRTEALAIRVAPGFGGELLVPSGPFEIAPGEAREVPLYISGGGEPGAERLGLLVVGGPDPIVLQMDIRPELALAAVADTSISRKPSRSRGRLAVAAGGAVIAACVALGLAVGGRFMHLPAFVGGVPTVAAARLDIRPHVVNFGDLPLRLKTIAPPGVAYHEPRARDPVRPRAPVAQRPAIPPPAIVALSVPETAGSGGSVKVRFATKRAAQVEVVAKIGPIVVADRITSATNGSITLPVPRTMRWVKIMIVHVMAQRDGGHAAQSALVAILPANEYKQQEVSLR